jgi:hypothetical protein
MKAKVSKICMETKKNDFTPQRTPFFDPIGCIFADSPLISDACKTGSRPVKTIMFRLY